MTSPCQWCKIASPARPQQAFIIRAQRQIKTAFRLDGRVCVAHRLEEGHMPGALRHFKRSSQVRRRRAIGVSAVGGGGLLLIALLMIPLFPPFSFLYAGALAAVGLAAILTIAGAIVGIVVF